MGSEMCIRDRGSGVSWVDRGTSTIYMVVFVCLFRYNSIHTKVKGLGRVETVGMFPPAVNLMPWADALSFFMEHHRDTFAVVAFYTRYIRSTWYCSHPVCIVPSCMPIYIGLSRPAP